MATLTVWKFPAADAAGAALDKLGELQEQQIITIQDAATVMWKEGAKRPKTKQAVNLTGFGALDGAFWGLLFGVLFFVPLIGMAIGAAMGALTGSLSDIGIDDDFIDSCREKITPGTSALFLLSENAVVDKVQAAFADQPMELIASNLSEAQEAQIQNVFGGGDTNDD